MKSRVGSCGSQATTTCSPGSTKEGTTLGPSFGVPDGPPALGLLARKPIQKSKNLGLFPVIFHRRPRGGVYA